MSRIARVTIPGIPHHITQRGNRRQNVFFSDADRSLYLRLLKDQGKRFGITFWAYCLMDNHVHIIAVPENERSFSHGLGEVHRRYTSILNYREGWSGYLWQGRFASFPLDNSYLYAAMRYVELNPVRAGMVHEPEAYFWSSAKAHVLKVKDALLGEHFLSDEIKDWKDFLVAGDVDNFGVKFEQHSLTGRPLGEATFIHSLEQKLGRSLSLQRRGPKPKSKKLISDLV